MLQKIFSFLLPNFRENYHTLIQKNWNDFIPKPLGEFTNERKEQVKKLLFLMIKHKTYNKAAFLKECRIDLPSNIELFSVYVECVKSFYISRDLGLEKAVTSSKSRIASGVLVYTTVLSPTPTDENGNVSKFTCAWDCDYCPNQPNTARSYIDTEPAVARGKQHKWDAVEQVRDRHFSYATNNLIDVFSKPTVKGEFIVEGGTWNSFPKFYRYKFITELFYAANTIYDDYKRPMLSLKEEQKINETVNGIRIIGLSVETRPDCVNDAFILECRELGVTLIQIGIQTIDDEVLERNNRGCKNIHTINAIKKLLNSNYKIQGHLMPDMYGSSFELDKLIISEFFSSSLYRVDHLKVYPCMILPYTVLYEKWKRGEFVPYGTDNKKMLELLIHMTEEIIKNKCFYLRKARLVRDFITSDIFAGTNEMNMADVLMKECIDRGTRCICSRCREAGKTKFTRNNEDILNPILKIRRYQASEGTEVFISYESKDELTIYGFLRLRLTDSPNPIFPELSNAAMIRELHVYNISIPVGDKSDSSVQHLSLGKKMIAEAEKIAIYEGYTKLSVIAGTGVKEYYRKQGFVNAPNFLIKHLTIE